MKIVAVTPLYPPASRVGAWLATHELLRGLQARGHEVVVYRRMSGSKPYALDGINVFPGQPLEPLGAAVAAADVVVSHCGDDGLASHLANERGVPSVRMVHGHHDNIEHRLYGATLAVFNSAHLAETAGWDGPQIVVHPPVRPGLKVTPGDRVTLVNLSSAKGGPLFWKLSKRMPGVKFLAVKGGWGVQAVYYRRNVKSMPAQQDMAKVYAQTRILLMPSVRESYGLVGVEAMSCGIPVIAHPTPGLRESLGDAGVFVDRADERGWVDAITRLRDAGEWRVASARALERVSALDPVGDIARFVEAIESFSKVAA